MSELQEKWRTTFNDLMTLLMVFFVLLFSLGGMSKTDETRFLNKLQSGLGILNEGQMTRVGVIEPVSHLPLESQEELEVLMKAMEMERGVGQLVEELKAGFGGPELGLTKDIEGILTPEGIRIRVGGDLLFPLGEAELSGKAKEVLTGLADFLGSISNEIVVEGHTDNIPIRSGKYASNWELSVARATNVVKFLVGKGIDQR
ncbi:MAG: flagellar motor protein MotB, partial [Desulfatiglandales bacterium]